MHHAGRGLRPLRCGGNPPRRASLVILLGVNSNCPNSGECIALQQGLKNKQMFAIINEARKYKYIRFSNLSIYLIYCN